MGERPNWPQDGTPVGNDRIQNPRCDSMGQSFFVALCMLGESVGLFVECKTIFDKCNA